MDPARSTRLGTSASGSSVPARSRLRRRSSRRGTTRPVLLETVTPMRRPCMRGTTKCEPVGEGPAPSTARGSTRNPPPGAVPGGSGVRSNARVSSKPLTRIFPSPTSRSGADCRPSPDSHRSVRQRPPSSLAIVLAFETMSRPRPSIAMRPMGLRPSGDSTASQPCAVRRARPRLVAAQSVPSEDSAKPFT